MMSDYFPAASPTTIFGFVSELLAAPKQTRFAIRQGLRAFGDPRSDTTFEHVAEDFIKVAEEVDK